MSLEDKTTNSTFFSNITEEKLPQICDEILALLKNRRVITLTGELGAGKTTLSRALLRKLGHHGRVMSPSFIICCEYQIEDKNFHHFDFYRLTDFHSLIDLGFEETLDTSDLVLIEWAEIFAEEMKELRLDGLQITISIAEDQTRNISIEELP
jgi:tRNA threonylcarbamoyladenosine biosynthesis protein TsaE